MNDARHADIARKAVVGDIDQSGLVSSAEACCTPGAASRSNDAAMTSAIVAATAMPANPMMSAFFIAVSAPRKEADHVID
jgi:hypothetical protein